MSKQDKTFPFEFDRLNVSVIIPTYNGKHKIGNVLTALSKQSYKDFEILVVIDGSTDGTAEYLQQSNFGISYKVYSQENKGRGAVRNLGASLAMGSLLIFVDDDMRPNFRFIEEHIIHHLKYKCTLMSGAQIDDPKKASTAFQKYKSYLSRKWAEPLCSTEGSPLAIEKMHLTAANFSIQKALFEKLGGFDEKLKDNEDLDLAIRAFYEGYKIYYNHKAFAWHDDFPSCKSFIKRQSEYNFYHNYVRLTKKELYGQISRFSEKKYKLNYFKIIFYFFWKSDCWVMLVDKGKLGLLPQKVQFRIYDWIIYAQLNKERLQLIHTI